MRHESGERNNESLTPFRDMDYRCEYHDIVYNERIDQTMSKTFKMLFSLDG